MPSPLASTKLVTISKTQVQRAASKELAQTLEVNPALKKAIDLSSNNRTPDPRELIFWGITRGVVRIDAKLPQNSQAIASAGAELLTYAWPWLWSNHDRDQLTPSTFLDIEGSPGGKVTMKSAAIAAAKLAAGEPWDVYSNAEGLALYRAAGGVTRRVWLAAWKYNLSNQNVVDLDNLTRSCFMVQVAPGRDPRFGFNWAGRGDWDLSIYYG